jgi:MFS family permease
VSPSVTPARVIRTYLAITGLFNGALALIWGVNTLFLLGAGLDILDVMLVNAAFSFGQFVFEIPTGVVADTVGRRASLLLCLFTVLLSTLAYVAMPRLGLGVGAFVAVSVILGLGFTFYSGAVEAWLVDTLEHLGHEGPLEPIFARSQVVFGVAMLIGTTAGGVIGQVHLQLPYVLRAALLVPAIVVAWRGMVEPGRERKPFELERLPAAMKGVFIDGVRFGLRHRVVRPLMLASAVAATFGMFGFYSWQRYFLDLLGRDLVWVTGLIAAFVGLSGVVGTLLLPRVSRLLERRSSVLTWAVVIRSVAIVFAGLAGNFYLAVGMYLLAGVAQGVAGPVRSALFNANIPSEQRATIISVDSLMQELGAGGGQSAWGYVSRARSIGEAWVGAGLFTLLGLPFLGLIRRATADKDRFEPKPGVS